VREVRARHELACPRRLSSMLFLVRKGNQEIWRRATDTLRCRLESVRLEAQGRSSKVTKG
jgi:hypothetical protein